jgi:hypothetical protein
MTAWTDIDAIQEGLRSLLTSVTGNDAFGNSIAIAKVYADADERDITFDNMPCIDITIDREEPEVLAGQNYYATLVLKVAIYVTDFTSFKNSCTLRNNLLKSAKDLIRNSPSFHADIETSRLGTITFAKAADEETGAFVSVAEMDVFGMGYRDK